MAQTDVIPLRFGEPGQDRFGLLLAPADARTGVVMCGPFGQEALRVHRVMRLLGERLARRGLAVLRFDYRGTGDSSGEDEAIRIEDWIDDIRAADTLLRERTSVVRTRWLGLRLGAALALRAAAGKGLAPELIVTWDGIRDGAAYLDDLEAAHRQMLRASALGFIDSMRQASGGEAETAARDERLGFPVPAAFREGLHRLLQGDAALPTGTRLVAMSGSSATGAAGAIRLPSDLAWLIDGADDFPSVPVETLNAVTDACAEGA